MFQPYLIRDCLNTVEIQLVYGLSTDQYERWSKLDSKLIRGGELLRFGVIGQAVGL